MTTSAAPRLPVLACALCLPAVVGLLLLARTPQGSAGAGLALVLACLAWWRREVSAASDKAKRRVRLRCHALARRGEWPASWEACRQMPEVAELAKGLGIDPASGFALLDHPNPFAQYVVLLGLAGNGPYRSRHTAKLARLSGSSDEPAIRAAALAAMAGGREDQVFPAATRLLNDPHREVRAEALKLVADPPASWGRRRAAVRQALVEPKASRDGAVPFRPGLLPDNLLDDLTVWSVEPAPLGHRAGLTLVQYYRQSLSERVSPVLIDEANARTLDPRAGLELRIDLAQMLRDMHALSPTTLAAFTHQDQPSALRALGAEGQLQAGGGPDAIEAVRALALSPNREIALRAAVLAQRYLKADLGVDPNKPPHPAGREAADVIRRVAVWASRIPAREAPAFGTGPRHQDAFAPVAEVVPMGPPSAGAIDPFALRKHTYPNMILPDAMPHDPPEAEVVGDEHPPAQRAELDAPGNFWN